MKRIIKERSLKTAVKATLMAAVVTTCGMALSVQSPDTKYVGISNCKMCHSDKHEAWLETAHSRAFDRLLAVGKQGSKECVGCHTTGYGKEGGYVDEETTPDMKNVQCESCHGPGKSHNGNADEITKSPAAMVCAGCHMDRNIHAE